MQGGRLRTRCGLDCDAIVQIFMRLRLQNGPELDALPDTLAVKAVAGGLMQSV